MSMRGKKNSPSCYCVILKLFSGYVRVFFRPENDFLPKFRNCSSEEYCGLGNNGNFNRNTAWENLPDSPSREEPKLTVISNSAVCTHGLSGTREVGGFLLRSSIEFQYLRRNPKKKEVLYKPPPPPAPAQPVKVPPVGRSVSGLWVAYSSSLPLGLFFDAGL